MPVAYFPRDTLLDGRKIWSVRARCVACEFVVIAKRYARTLHVHTRDDVDLCRLSDAQTAYHTSESRKRAE